MTESSSFPEPDTAAAEMARDRQVRLTKPPGSLGRLEDLAVQLAAFQGRPLPRSRPAAALLFAADHPVTRHGVSPYPSAVTRAMLSNFARGGAAASVLARAHGMPLLVVDVGVNRSAGVTHFQGEGAEVRRDPVAEDLSGDIRVEDAMSRATFDRCIAAGRAAVRSFGDDLKVLALGDMGIGNTTVAAAVTAALLGGDPGDFVGAGTGADPDMLANKRDVVRDAVARLGGTVSPEEAVRRTGGREMAALLGAMTAALESRAVVLVDGFIVTAVALALATREPRALSGMIFAHRSEERAHARVLSHLDVRPLLDLGMRLGEASGALAAFPLVELACALHAQMATFESASVPDRGAPE